ncbi:MAG: CDP-alcohol phosphatidyltransferase family protein [bacterium]|nr:CDP-alcohol phosphatidyltransferase family protein [bacterium]
MSDYAPSSRRPIADLFRKTARAAVRGCVAWGIHPDAISYASIVAAAGAAACFSQAAGRPWLLVPAALLCFVRLWFNMLDGMVALASGKASLRGEILNELPDRISDVLIFVGVAHSHLCHPLGGYWTAILALFVAYVGTFGQALGVGRQFAGVMTKPWRMVAVSAGGLITLGLLELRGGELRAAGLTPLDWTHLVIIAGSLATIAVRLRSILRTLANRTEPAQNRKGDGS